MKKKRNPNRPNNSSRVIHTPGNSDRLLSQELDVRKREEMETDELVLAEQNRVHLYGSR